MDTPELTPVDRLQITTGIAASFQNATQQADGKIGLLLIVHPGLTTLVLTRTGPLLTTHGGLRVVAVLLLTVFAVCFAGSGLHIAHALRPRTDVPGTPNRFAFVTVAGEAAGIEGAGATELNQEAWLLARALARTATAKNHHIAAAVTWLVPMVFCVAAGALLGSLP